MSRLARTQLWAVVRKEVRQTVRDRRMMFLILVSPLIQLIIFGEAVNLEVEQVPTVVVDQDGSRASRAHLRRLLADRTLKRVGATADLPRAQHMLETEAAAAIVVVPPGFGEDLTRGRTARVQAILDGSDPNRSGVASNAVARYFAQASQQIAVERMRARSRARGRDASRPEIELVPRVYFNPSLSTTIFMVPGLAAIVLLIVTTIVMAMGLAREREMGTLEQILVTPMSAGVILIGRILPFVVIGLLDFALAIAAGAWIFDMPLRGNLWLLMGATVLYLMCSLGAGLYISTISDSQQQAFMGGFLGMLPAVLLSGIMTPIQAIPEWLRWVTYLNPVRYYIETLRGVLLKGATASDLGLQIAALALFGILVVGAAIRRFRMSVR